MRRLFTLIVLVFFSWTFIGQEVASKIAFTFDNKETETSLIHYWHFNNAEITEDDLVFSDFSAVGEGVISYPGTGDGYMDFRTHRAADPVSNFNLRMGQEPDQGAVLRVRNPANTRELLIAAPSTGYENLVVSFATTRTGNGAQQQEFYFSPDNGATWTQVGETYDIPELDPELDDFGYLHKVIDLSDIAAVNNNPGLHFKVLFVGEGADNTSGNNRFDNLTVDGSPVVEPELDLVHYWHFNNAEITEDDLVFSDFSAVGEGVISYPGTGDGYMDFRTHRAADPVSNFNLRMGQEPDQGAILRVRNPANTRELLIAAPSTGYENLVVTFATTRSGSGGQEQEFYYSADNGNTWVQVGEAYEVHEHDPEAENFGYVYKVFDLSAHGEINNNPDLHFRIMSVGEGSDGSSGNQRFDNLTVDGSPVVEPELDLVHYWHFNNAEITEDDLVFSDFSAVGEGVISYPGEGDGYMDFRTHRAADPVSNFNLRMGQEPDQGAILRVRNPANTRELLIAAPSTGYENLVVTFATTRSGSGGQEQEFYYSADNGNTWVQVGEAYDVHEHDPEAENFGYVYKVFDLSAYGEINNNPDLHFRIMSVGEGSDGSSGNQRFDNLTVDGTPVETTLPATALSITSINQGDPVYANEPFSITIQAIDEEGAPAAVDSDVEINLSLASGTGTLGGNLTGILEAGSFSVNIEGVTYDTVESDVSVTASADDMEPATSETFDVLLRTYNLSLTINIPGAGELSGEGDYEVDEEVTIVADANEGYEFVRWTIDGEEISADHSHTFAMPAQDLVIRAEFAEEITGDLMLVHYWHFNDLTGATITDPLESDYSIGVLSAYITYPGEGAGYMDARTHRESDPVSNFNLRLGQEPDQGAVLRARNPAATRELLFEIPSTGFESLVVTFATTRTENGSQEQQFEYSADGGDTWVQAGDDYEIPFIEDEEGIYLHKIIDLAGIEEVNDNPDLFFRILFVGEGNDNDSGNNRFDNFTVDGIPLSDDVSTFEPETFPTIFVNPNPARNYFNITVTEPGTLVSIYNISGQLLFHEKVESTTITLDTSTFGSGLYFIRGISPSKNLPETLRLVIP